MTDFMELKLNGKSIGVADAKEGKILLDYIAELQAEKEVMHQNMLTVVGASTGVKQQLAELEKECAFYRCCMLSGEIGEYEAALEKKL